jgi:hypothetical protein
MPRLQRRSFADSEEVRRFPNGEVRLVTLDDFVIGEFSLKPGWRWSAGAGRRTSVRSRGPRSASIVTSAW